LFGLLIASVALITIWQQFRPVRDMAVSARKFAGDGKPLLVKSGGSPDIRELVEAFNHLQQQVATLLSNRTLMMSAMSHDVRTYLTRLRLRIEALEPESRTAAERTINEIQALLEDTLAFAESETAMADRAPVDLAKLVEELVSSGQFDEGKVALAMQDRPIVAGHAGRLRRAIVNLITNAVKFGSLADVKLRSDAGHAVLTISDHGPGIPEGERDLVFQPFYRRDSSRRRNVEGAGLGLAIVRSIIAQHGGDIRLGDRPGGGLAVTVRLPLQP
jgi:signal transduction histidine kinase